MSVDFSPTIKKSPHQTQEMKEYSIRKFVFFLTETITETTILIMYEQLTKAILKLGLYSQNLLLQI